MHFYYGTLEQVNKIRRTAFIPQPFTPTFHKVHMRKRLWWTLTMALRQIPKPTHQITLPRNWHTRINTIHILSTNCMTENKKSCRAQKYQHKSPSILSALVAIIPHSFTHYWFIHRSEIKHAQTQINGAHCYHSIPNKSAVRRAASSCLLKKRHVRTKHCTVSYREQVLINEQGRNDRSNLHKRIQIQNGTKDTNSKTLKHWSSYRLTKPHDSPNGQSQWQDQRWNASW